MIYLHHIQRFGRQIRAARNSFLLFPLAILGFFVTTIVAQKVDIVVESGHTQGVRRVIFSPDGKLLASAGLDRIIILWDRASGKVLKKLAGHLDPVDAFDFSPDGKLLASVSSPAVNSDVKRICLWQIETAQRLWQVDTDAGEGRTAAFSPDGKMVAIGGRNGEGTGDISVWDVASGKPIEGKFVGHSGLVTSLRFSKSGKELVSASDDRTLRTWDIASGVEIKKVELRAAGHGGERAFEFFDFSLDGNVAATSNGSSGIYLWNTLTGKKLAKVLRGSPLGFDRSGKTLAIRCAGNSICLFDVSTLLERKRITIGAATIETRFLAVSPDEKTAVFLQGVDDRTINLRYVDSRKTKILVNGSNTAGSIAFRPDGQMIAIGSSVMDLNGDAPLKNFKGQDPLLGNIRGFSPAVFSPDGRFLATQVDDKAGHAVVLWDVATGEKKQFLCNTENQILSIAFSKDGSMIAAGSVPGKASSGLCLWLIRDEIEYRPKSETGAIASVAFNPVEQTIASGDSLGRVHLTTKYGSELGELSETHNDEVLAVAISPDGRWLASSGERNIYLWDMASRKLIRKLYGHDDRVVSLAFSPDSAELISGSWDHSVRIWNTADGSEMERFDGHSNQVNSVAFDPSGKLAASVSDDGTARLWGVKTGEEIAVLSVLDNEEWVVTTPDGRFDTNKSLDDIQGLHWIVNDRILQPIALEAFMRQYYEPGLVRRVLKCNSEAESDGTDSCDKEFKPLPPIGAINRLQPQVRAQTGAQTEE